MKHAIRPTASRTTRPAAAWLRAGLAGLAVMVAGCSALRIDVDVYKGPLVNHESMQRGQMVSMALSAKSLLLSMRNRLIEGVRPGYVSAQVDDDWRLRTLSRGELLRISRCGKAMPGPSDCDPVVDGQAVDELSDNKDLRNVRQINDILSFYDDQDDHGIAGLLEEFRAHQQAYARLMRDLVLSDARTKAWTNPQRSEPLRRAQLSLRDQWLDMSELMQTAQARQQLLAAPAHRQLLALAAEGLANLSQPLLLACVIAIHPHNSQLRALDAATGGALRLDARAWKSEDFARARTSLERALQRNPEPLRKALHEADAQLRAANHEQLQACYLPGLAIERQRDRIELGLPQRNKAGLVRSPKIWDEQEPEEDSRELDNRLDAILPQLLSLGAGGFDRGRRSQGVDSLATQLALVRARGPVPGQDADREKSNQTRLEEQLDQQLVDLAARIQFLAGNLWLLDERTDAPWFLGDGNKAVQIDKYKALLEGIANNILVHADDLRHRQAHEQQQVQTASMERHAAAQGLAPNARLSFQRVVQAVQDEKARIKTAEAAASAAASALATPALEQAVANKAAAAERATQATQKRRNMLGLHWMLSGSKTDKTLPKGLPESMGTAEDWAADRESLQAKLHANSATAKKLKLESLRQSLEDGLTALQAGRSSDALKATAGALRVQTVLDAAKTLKPLDNVDELAHSAALASLRSHVNQALKLLVEVEAKEAKAKDEAEAAVTEQRRLQSQNQSRIAQTISTHGVAGARFDAAIDAIQKQGDAVTSDLAKLDAPADTRLVASLLATKLLGDGPTAAASADAKRILDSLRFARSAALPPTEDQPLDAGKKQGRRDMSIDVMDATIAQLRYLNLQAVQARGADDAEAKRLLQALNLARKQREDMIYLRPTSSYLRSVYAATFSQSDPGLRSRNLLLDTWRRLSDCAGPKKPLCDVRDELDKSHWQNINTVRLDGAGNTNFVVAKDDVGNWYAKAMGNDPKAMISAVKNLALYNLGGRFNTDLLRVDELRGRVDDTTLAKTDRDRAKDELDKLSTTTSGPAVAARSETLGLFKANYDERSAADRSQLASALIGDSLQSQLRTLWYASYTDAKARSQLGESLAAAEVVPALDAARAALATDAAPVPAAGEAIAAALGALQRWRAALKAQVGKLEALTEAERLDQAQATSKLTTAQEQLAAAQTQLQAAQTQALDKAAKARDSTLSESQAVAANKAADDAQNALKLRGGEVEAHARKVEEAKLALAEATTRLQAAQGRQRKAAADVDTVVQPLITTTTERRLRLVEETETAIKVIGRSAAPAKSP